MQKQPKPKLLEHRKIEAMNTEERKKFDEEERLEHKEFVKEHKKIIILEKAEKKKDLTIKQKDQKGKKKNPTKKEVESIDE